MRTPESKIKEAILHPEKMARLAAVRYFARSHTEDESIMPLVIQAVETHGRDKAVGILRAAEGLPQTEATVQWLAGELAKDWDLEDVANDNYCTAVAAILCGAPCPLLKPEFAELPCFPEELQYCLAERLEMASWDWEFGWAALEILGEEVAERGGHRRGDRRRGDRILESLARHRDKGEPLLRLLHRRYKGYDKVVMLCLEPLLAELAGRMRLEAAVPILVERMLENDSDLVDACSTALTWIGGDLVVRALAEGWPEGEDDYRMGAAEAMEHIHTDLSVQKCLEFLADEEDSFIAEFLADALLGNFAEEAIEPIRQMVQVDEDSLDPQLMDVKGHLVAACMVMGSPFPQDHPWHKEAVEEDWDPSSAQLEWIREEFDEDEEWDEDEQWDDDEDFDDEEDFDDDEFDEEEDLEDEDWDEDGEFGYLRDALKAKSDQPRPAVNETPRVGRNAPCPCGSGRKYKKCCLGKDQKQEE